MEVIKNNWKDITMVEGIQRLCDPGDEEVQKLKYTVVKENKKEVEVTCEVAGGELFLKIEVLGDKHSETLSVRRIPVYVPPIIMLDRLWKALKEL